MASVKASYASTADTRAQRHVSEPERETVPKSRASEIASKRWTEKK